MKVVAIQTPTVQPGDNLLGILATSISDLPEKSVVVVTSKVVALWEGAVADVERTRKNKQELVVSQSELYTLPSSSRYELSLTIRDGVLGIDAGIDESNISEGYVLLPENAFESAKTIWNFLRDTFGVAELGVIITDSTSLPLKWGVLGRYLGHCGFMALSNKIGQKDLFGRPMTMTQVAVAEALAVAAVFEMGEVAESTPIALITDIPQIEFTSSPPTEEDIRSLHIDLEDDAYAPMITRAQWKRGERKAYYANKETD